jgi:hypothetical protein
MYEDVCMHASTNSSTLCIYVYGGMHQYTLPMMEYLLMVCSMQGY